MSTLLDVGSAALTFVGQLGAGQTASPEDGAQILRMANLILQEKSVNRLFLYVINFQDITLIDNADSLTLGPTGSTVRARPTFVESAQIRYAGKNSWFPVSILEKSEWDAIQGKGAVDELATKVYPSPTYPNMTVYTNPRVTGSPVIRLGIWDQLTQFVTLFDTIAFPPAYEEFLEAKLAQRLAPLYDQTVTQDIMQRVNEAEAAVQSINAQGLGGALSAEQKLQSPNLGQPIVPGGSGQ